MANEIDFPRGKSSAESQTFIKSKKRKHDNEDLFKVRKSVSNDKDGDKEKNKKKSKKSKKGEDENGNAVKILIEQMTVKKLPDDIVILGCIQEISDYELKMCLPGGVIAKVPITHISNSYTKLLEKLAYNSGDGEVLKPNGMFQIGQYYPCKIMSKRECEGYGMVEVIASLNPKDIYANVIASYMLKIPKMIVVAAVESLEDHGYVMDIGINGIKAFLPNGSALNAIEMMKNRKSLAIGQLVVCVIDKVDNERSVQLTTKAKTMKNSIITNNISTPLSCLIPGCIVEATVMDVNDKGLELNVITDFSGFVHHNQLASTWEIAKKSYTIGQKVTGSVLYVNPITKHVVVSLRPKLDPMSVNKLWSKIKIGSVEKAEVVGHLMDGVVFKLPGDMKAFAGKKHLGEKDEVEEESFDVHMKFEIGSKHKCRIQSINLMDSLAKVTLRHSIISAPTILADDLNVGDIYKGVVKNITEKGILIQIGFGLKGFVPNIHLTESGTISHPEKLYPIGKEVKCRIIKMDKSVRPVKMALTLKKSLLKEDFKPIVNYEDVKPNSETDGVIVLIQKKGALVEFFNGVKGWIPTRLMASYNVEDPEEVFKKGQMIHCSVIYVDVKEQRLTLSLLKSKKKEKKKTEDSKSSAKPESKIEKKKTKESKSDKKKTKETTTCLDQLKIGQIINATVDNLTPKGMLAAINDKLKGFVPDIHFRDQLPDNPRLLFSKGDKIECRIMKIDKKATPPRVIMTCKQTFLDEKLNILDNYENANSKAQSLGVVTLVQKKGILVEFFNGVKGYVPVKNMVKFGIKFPEDNFKRGQIVECSFDSVDLNSERMTCTLLSIKTDINNGVSVKEKAGKAISSEHKKNKRQRNDSLASQSDMSESDLPLQKVSKKLLSEPNAKSRLSAGDFLFDIEDATPNLNNIDVKDDVSSSESDDENESNENIKRKKTRKERSEDLREKEEHLRKREAQLMDTDRSPETVDDYERLILASPNSSLVWSQYMAFLLEQAEIDKARTVGERALREISFREEQEKVNIWVALMNLENLYGTQATLDELFQKAVQHNEPIKMYQHLANIYFQSENHEQAELLYQTMLKKFRQDKSVWIDFGVFYMKTNRADSARKLMERALASLDKRDHIEVISKFGQLEFKYADMERGKTIYENILASYPKKIDLWAVYIDLMIKYSKGEANDNLEAIRNVFERVITLKLPARKMKSMFKKYIDFESKYGNEDAIERIRQKAKEYVEVRQLD